MKLIDEHLKGNFLSKYKIVQPFIEKQSPYTLEVHPTYRCNYKCEFCFIAGTKVLMKDFTYKNIEDIEINDEIIGYKKGKKGKQSQLVYSKVTNTMIHDVDEVITLKFENGVMLTSTLDHKISPYNYGNEWRKAKDFKIGNKVRAVTTTDFKLNIDDDYKLGWITGMCDGDGCFSTRKDVKKYNTYNYRSFRLAVNDQKILERFEEYVKYFSFDILKGKHHKTYQYKDNKPEKKIMDCLTIQKHNECLRFEEFIKKGRKDRSLNYIRGWLGGFFDADGSSSGSKSVRISQKYSQDPKYSKNMFNILCLRDFFNKLNFKVSENKRKNNIVNFTMNGGKSENIRFLIETFPSLQRKKDPFVNCGLSSKFLEITDRKISNKKTTVYNITTEVGNYIANGIHVKNCIDKFLKEVPSTDGKQINCDGESELTEENMDTIVQGCLDLGIKGIILSGGGDPPMNPNTKYLVQQSNNNKISIGMFTNGFILNDETIPIYIDNLTFLRFSFDSFSPEEYAKTKGVSEKAYYRVIDNIRKCTEYKNKYNSKCKIGIDFIIQPHNVHLISHIYNEAASLNVDYIQFCDCVVPGYEFTANQNKKILTEIEKCLKIKSDTIDVGMPEVVYEPAQVENTTNCKDCEMRQYIFQVGGDGGVRVCPHLARHDHLLYGNINDKSLKEIWDNKHDDMKDFLYEYCRFREQNKILKGLQKIEHGDLL